MKQAPFSSIALDAISGFVITANAISIGVGVDCHDSVEVDILELCFTAYFVFELIFKLYLYGCRRFCSGPRRARADDVRNTFSDELRYMGPCGTSRARRSPNRGESEGFSDAGSSTSAIDHSATTHRPRIGTGSA